ncbi:MAG TPA: hypothetical protein VFF84_10505 [Sphingobium sp.]|nr:hypothetical protein [Sphingobium sp.]
MRPYLLPLLCLNLGFMSACSSPTNFEKTFVTQGPNYVIMLQLHSPDSRSVFGSVISTEVVEGMRVVAGNKPISGTIEGKAINFTINHPPGNDPPNTPVSGIMSGNDLTLTFYAHGNATELTFHRSTAEKYEAAVKETFKNIAEFD